eukprot:gene63690-87110_t
MASSAATPLEQQYSTIAGIDSMTSSSSLGSTSITLQFNLDRSIDGAAQDVQAAINAAAGVLPKNLPYPPVYAKVNPADAPVMTLALTSDTISLRAMSDISDTLLAQRLSQISGVGRVAVLGGPSPPPGTVCVSTRSIRSPGKTKPATPVCTDTGTVTARMPGPSAAARKPRSPGLTSMPWVIGAPAVIALRTPLHLHLLVAVFLAGWVLVATFPLFWTAIMSFKL